MGCFARKNDQFGNSPRSESIRFQSVGTPKGTGRGQFSL